MDIDYRHAWGAAVVMSAAGSGFGVFLLAMWVVTRRLPPTVHAMGTSVFITDILLGIVLCATAVLLLVRRRQFCRMSRVAQWGAVAALLLVVVGMTIMLGWAIP
jgi:hypothetical protein